MKKRVNKVIDEAKRQAKQSLKILESIEKETLAKAKNFVKIPVPGDPKKMTNDKILASLRKIGVAAESDVESLRLRIEKLEAQLAIQNEGSAEGSGAAFPQ